MRIGFKKFSLSCKICLLYRLRINFKKFDTSAEFCNTEYFERNFKCILDKFKPFDPLNLPRALLVSQQCLLSFYFASLGSLTLITALFSFVSYVCSMLLSESRSSNVIIMERFFSSDFLLLRSKANIKKV